MSIKADHNLYPGINPHLNSALQQPGGDWTSFHADYIIRLSDMIDAVLPEAYSIKVESSLQLRVLEPGETGMVTRRPDLLIKRDPSAASRRQALPASGGMNIPILDILDVEEDGLTALVIYKGGKPVTQIEIISPGNKPPSLEAQVYRVKRTECLYAGLRLVEIDYVHERRPTTPHLFSYPDREETAVPYRILVFDPRPSLEEGLAAVYGFGVMDAFPEIIIPLDGADTITVNPGVAYRIMYNRRSVWQSVDYAQEPANMSAYTEADQAAIRARMAQIAAERPTT
jgi:hypothetical protein